MNEHEEEKINPGHSEIRAFLRIVGPGVALLGLVFTAIGMVSFFSAFGSGGPPRYFWCAFIGLPLLAIGGGISQFAFIGAISRYQAGEVAPVGKDTFNYMADGTKEGVQTLAHAVGEGLGIARGTGSAAIRCHKCNHVNRPDAKYCEQCGAPQEKSKPCPSCQEWNDPDARFCDHCGKPLPAAGED